MQRPLLGGALLGALLLVPAHAHATPALSPEEELMISPPRPPTPARVVHRRALGLGITAGIFGVSWLLMKGIAGASDRRVAREIESGASDPSDCAESCYAGPLLNASGSALLIGAAGFLGGSMHAHGRLLGRQGRGPGGSARKGKLLAGLGAGLLVGSFAALAGGLVAARSTDSPRAWVNLRELGWWSATALGLSGSALAGLGHGIVRGHDERGAAAEVSLVPTFGRAGLGLALVGRF